MSMAGVSKSSLSWRVGGLDFQGVFWLVRTAAKRTVIDTEEPSHGPRQDPSSLGACSQKPFRPGRHPPRKGIAENPCNPCFLLQVTQTLVIGIPPIHPREPCSHQVPIERAIRELHVQVDRNRSSAGATVLPGATVASSVAARFAASAAVGRWVFSGHVVKGYASEPRSTPNHTHGSKCGSPVPAASVEWAQRSASDVR